MSKKRKRQRRAPAPVSRPRCGLCGKTRRLTKTECCDQWICDDEDQYVIFSYARNSCYRNHRRYTLCGHHHEELHPGDWKDCPECREDFETEMYVHCGTNEYNFEKLENPPEYEPTRCAECGQVIVLGEEGYSRKGGKYYCLACADVQLPDFSRVADERRLEEIRDPEQLVDLLFEEGKTLSPELQERILAMGSTCVQPLLEVLNDEALQMDDAPGEGWAPIHAARLLGDMGAADAVPSIVKWLLDVDFGAILHGELMDALGKMGAPAVQALLNAWGETTDPSVRTSICEALSRAGVRNEAIYGALLEHFEEDPEIGAGFLAEYGDSRALPELQRALDAYEIPDEAPGLLGHRPVIGLQVAIEALGGQLTPAQEEKVHRAEAQQEALGNRLSQRPAQRERKIGRNDSCWCGSGKKYKHCHWGADRTSRN